MNKDSIDKPELPRSLVVGYGSIGARHEEVLRTLGAKTAVVSRHAGDLSCLCFQTVREALREFRPHYVVVANRTSEHMGTLEQLEQLDFRGICLVEKPLAEQPVSNEWKLGFSLFVGYVMRFHPLIQKAMELLQGKRLLSIHAYAGQYLPDWRPDTDYRTCYSANWAQGGGVLRDLSHELDYIALLAGSWKQVSARGGHLSGLEIETDDVYGLLMETQNCPLVLCQLNYLDRNVRRDCTIQYEGGTIHIDFIGNQLVHNGIGEKTALERNDMFKAMHQATFSPEQKYLCSYQEAVQTLELIEAAEESSREGSWVCKTSR